MGEVSKTIQKGTIMVVEKQQYDTKYLRIAKMSLANSMEIVGEIFKMAWVSEDGSMMSGLDMGGKEEKAWEPELFKKAVCCMEGMKCWNGAFEALQGKANLEKELKQYQAQLP